MINSSWAQSELAATDTDHAWIRRLALYGPLTAAGIGIGWLVHAFSAQAGLLSHHFGAAWNGTASWLFVAFALTSSRLSSGLLHGAFAVVLIALAIASLHGAPAGPIAICGVQAAWAAAHLDDADKDHHPLFLLWAVINLTLVARALAGQP